MKYATECNTCGGGTGQPYPCVCSAPKIRALMQQRDELLAGKQPKLTVKLRSLPESNGKRNWTATLCRVEKWDGLVGSLGGVTVARGELWNRVAYAAERAKYLIGERDTEPYILDYGDDIETPDQWKGESIAKVGVK